jgi:hypothetical protein
MGELQSLADANGGALPSALLVRTPSPHIGAVGPLQESNRDVSLLKEDRNNDPFSVGPVSSSIAQPRHSEVMGRENDFSENYTRRPMQVSHTTPGHFTPFSPEFGPRRIPSPGSYGPMLVEGASTVGASFGHLRDSRPFDPVMSELSAPPIGLDMDMIHRHPELSLDDFHHPQPRELLRGPIQPSQVPGHNALLPQQHNAPRFGRSSPFGSGVEEIMYDARELAHDEFVQGSLYGGAPTTNMNRIPTYRRDYGAPSPASGWHGR